jgi:AraC family L-rhamnose operon transcriptional activator RhaR/AraC family L-rhamnose operon regulatory protein RhaS
MSRSDTIIGTAIEHAGDRARIQRCHGTYAGDMADPEFRLNVLFVRHETDFPLHEHEYCELVLVLGGSAIHVTDEQRYPIERGDVFVVTGRSRHGFEAPQGLELCNIQYDPVQFLKAQPELERMPGYHALFDLEPRCVSPGGSPQHLRLDGAELEEARRRAEAIQREFDGRRDGYQTAVRSHFLLLVTELSRLYEREADPDSVMRMASVASYIRRHFRRPLRVDQLAGIAGLSASQFQRRFKSVYRTTPVRFITQLRIDEACRLLRRSSRDVGSIAAEVGFSTTSFFCTQFKAITGLPPNQWRKQHAEPRWQAAPGIDHRIAS